MIKLYALSTCPHCKKTKALLKEHNVEYDVIDVDLAPQEESEKALAEVEKLTGQRAFPVLVINDIVILGHKPDAILEALQNA